MKIYCAHPMTGLTVKEVKDYYKDLTKKLEAAGYDVLHPMIGKGDVIGARKFTACGSERNTLTTDKAIKGRDQWMVRQCDVLYVDLNKSKKVSIGCVGELSWGDAFGKHIVLVMEDGNIHEHAFINQIAHAVFSSPEEAIEYLEILAKKRC